MPNWYHYCSSCFYRDGQVQKVKDFILHEHPQKNWRIRDQHDPKFGLSLERLEPKNISVEKNILGLKLIFTTLCLFIDLVL